MISNTKKILIALVIITTLIFIASELIKTNSSEDCATENTTTEICPIDDIDFNKITNFKECVSAGNPIMESYPRRCKADGITYIEDISIRCTDEQRNVDACIEIYQPVCATVNIQCITTPCDPIKETYSNSCTACKNPLVYSYINGEC